MRKRIRRRELAEQFGVNIRTIDAWWKGRPAQPAKKGKKARPAKAGFLPPPHYLAGSPIPFWYDDEIEQSAPIIKSKTATA
jgi:hypothetical protein